MENKLDKWIKRFDNEEYPFDYKKYEKELKDDGIVVVFGQSDDLLELAGAYNDEFGAYGSVTIVWNDEKFICKDDFLKNHNNLSDKFFITSEPKSMVQFQYSTNIPCKWFNIYEYNELYCEGFIFELKSIYK